MKLRRLVTFAILLAGAVVVLPTATAAADGSIPSASFLRPSNGADVGARF